MQRFVRIPLFTLAILSLAAFAYAGENVKVVQPEISIEQVGGLPDFTNVGGPLTVEYQISVHNLSNEPITLTRVNLQSISPVTAYQLRGDSRPYDVTIAPESTAVVTYKALVSARGGLIGAQTPVDIKGVAYFSADVGGFAKAFTYTATPKSERTNS